MSTEFPIRRVAVLIETDDSWGREVVRSIAEYAHKRQWRLLIGPRDDQRRLRLPSVWTGDGVLVSLRDRGMAQHVRRRGLPAVDVSYTMPEETWLGRVATDDRDRARMAFEHFRSLKLEHFACYAPRIGRYSDQRTILFRRVVEEAGYSFSIYSGQKQRQGWGEDHRRVIDWLSQLPRPLAVFAADPYPARQLVEISQWEGIHVPDEVAILSGDTDDLLCNISFPRVTSIELACREIGQSACRMLELLMNGKPVPAKPKLIPPLRVIARQSTEVLAIDDKLIADALRYIRDHATKGIQVSDLLRVFPVSRRTLELRFRALLGHTPAEAIRRVKLLRARELLVETDLSVEAVAHASGVSSGAQLASDFRRYFGIRPSALRGGRRLHPATSGPDDFRAKPS